MSGPDLFREHSGRGALLSEDGRYRYRLWRLWDDLAPVMVWVMLNPSTADADLDDPTIRKCIGFAKANRHGGIIVVNLFAWRATDPKERQQYTRRGRRPQVDSSAWRYQIHGWNGHGRRLPK
jgi:hypothetical protein